MLNLIWSEDYHHQGLQNKQNNKEEGSKKTSNNETKITIARYIGRYNADTTIPYYQFIQGVSSSSTFEIENHILLYGEAFVRRVCLVYELIHRM